MVDTTQGILERSHEAGKTYAFDEQHDNRRPAQMWFQESDQGLILFVVFYTQACRWSKCLGCNLPSKSSQFHVDYKSLIAQVDFVFSDPDVVERRLSIRKVIVSNNGSVLDQETFSSTALMYLMGKINLTLPNIHTLTLETRPEYVDLAELEFLKRAIAEGDTATRLELAVGFEAYDEHIRNDVFMKGLSLEKFEAFVAHLAPFDYAVKCYLMQKPVPEMTDVEAIEDVHRAIDYLGRVGGQYGVRINVHLNPTYAAHDTPLGEGLRRGEYVPPYLADVARAALHARGKGLSIFIGLYDEGLAAPGGSFVREGDDALVELLEQFNRSQDFTLLEGVCADRITQAS